MLSGEIVIKLTIYHDDRLTVLRLFAIKSHVSTELLSLVFIPTELSFVNAYLSACFLVLNALTNDVFDVHTIDLC